MKAQWRTLVPYLLAALVVVLAALLLGQVMRLGAATVETYWLAREVAALASPPAKSAPAAAPRSAPGKPGGPPAVPEKYKPLLERGVFGRVDKGRASEPVCTGIVGQSAMINQQWVQSGSRVADCTVMRIERDRVWLERNGKPMELVLFPALPAGESK